MVIGNLLITPATINDAELLTKLGITTFVATFAKDNSKEDMDKYVAAEMNIDKISEELRDEGNLFYLVWCDGEIAGYSKMRRGNKPDELSDKNAIELERIYVLQEYHGKKIGAALLDKCLDYALGQGYDTLWLGVWEHNHRAVNFYKQWGFRFFGTHEFRLGDDVQTDQLMMKKL